MIMTEKYEYCSTVPRTFVQDCSFNFRCFCLFHESSLLSSFLEPSDRLIVRIKSRGQPVEAGWRVGGLGRGLSHRDCRTKDWLRPRRIVLMQWTATGGLFCMSVYNNF